MTNKVIISLRDNLSLLKTLPDASVNLIYIDPPFNTGKTQKRGDISYDDSFEDYGAFISARLTHAYRVLAPSGSLFFHIDYRESHYCKIILDGIFGRPSFINEIIWAYDYGGRPKNRWPAKHDTIFWYAKDPKDYTFNYDEVERIPYMAPSLVGPEKAARGKTLTDTWWHTIVPTNSKEKTGYATQKPLGLIQRIVKVHSNPGDKLLDFFAGSGTFGEAAAMNDRGVFLCDSNPDAVRIMEKRLRRFNPQLEGFDVEDQN